MTGATLKQVAWQEFCLALDAYREALASKNGRRIILASLRVHSASGGVPKRYRSAVGRVFRESMTPK